MFQLSGVHFSVVDHHDYDHVCDYEYNFKYDCEQSLLSYR